MTHAASHRAAVLTMPLTDPRVSEWIVDWKPEDVRAAQLDAQLYGNVLVSLDGRYIPWKESSQPVGVSPDYLKLLRGEISAQEYIHRVSREVED